MKKYLKISLAFFLLLTGCNQALQQTETPSLISSQVSQNTTSSAIESRDFKIVEIDKLIHDKLPLWVKMWKQKVPNFTIADFQQTYENTIKPDIQSTYNDKESDEEDLRKLLYVYAPDKTKFLDPHLGAEIYKEDNQLKVEYDADSGVMLFDKTSKTSKRLRFCGPSCGYDDAFWIDNSTFIIVGSTEYFPTTAVEEKTYANKTFFIPTIDLFDLTKNTVKHYEGAKTDSWLGGSEYLLKKFPQISES